MNRLPAVRLRIPASQSIGVVTFNGDQQRLIENQARRSAPSLEAHFDLNQTNEPILVKNKRERKDFIYVGKVGTGFNRKSSMEIRKKLDAILSSKSRLAKAPRLKGATWVLRADR